MDKFMDAHPLTVVIVMFAVLSTPLYLLATYVFSRASIRTGIWLAAGFTAWGAVMCWVNLAQAQEALGPFSPLLVPVCWIAPTALLIAFRRRLLRDPLSQRWLIGLQLFRVIGGVFLIEMTRGHIPGVFAYPAGIGDIAAGVLALAVLIRYRGGQPIPPAAIWAVVVFGMLDFFGAFATGFTSSEGPLHLFSREAPNQVILFPTGLIPMYLVPYAIMFHALSALSLIKFGSESDPAYGASAASSSASAVADLATASSQRSPSLGSA